MYYEDVLIILLSGRIGERRSRSAGRHQVSLLDIRPATRRQDEPATRPPAAPRFAAETVIDLRHWTPGLLSFRTSRSSGFRFTPGHYARLGLEDSGGSIVWRPMSIVSAASDAHLEFVATLVAGGQFSGLLGHARAGATIRVDRGSYGFLTVGEFAPGTELWLVASGSGIGPFISILRDPATWVAFATVVVVHSVRHADELAYRDEIAATRFDASLAATPQRLRYVPVVTREAHPAALPARIPRLIDDGRLEAAAGTSLDPQRSRVMVCGNPGLGRELRALLTARGYRVNRRGAPGHLAFENYWQSNPS
jgi:ferredoxin--NADP+ reductase